MQEIVFVIKKSEEGGYFAEAVGYPIFTQGENREEIKENVLEAVECYFEDGNLPNLIRVEFVEEELIKV